MPGRLGVVTEHRTPRSGGRGCSRAQERARSRQAGSCALRMHRRASSARLKACSQGSAPEPALEALQQAQREQPASPAASNARARWV